MLLNMHQSHWLSHHKFSLPFPHAQVKNPSPASSPRKNTCTVHIQIQYIHAFDFKNSKLYTQNCYI